MQRQNKYHQTRVNFDVNNDRTIVRNRELHLQREERINIDIKEKPKIKRKIIKVDK